MFFGVDTVVGDSGQSLPAGWGMSAIGLPCPLFNQPGEQALPSVFWLEALGISCQVSWTVTQWLNLGLAPTFSFLWIRASAGLEAVRNTIQRFIISVFSSSSVSKIKQRRKKDLYTSMDSRRYTSNQCTKEEVPELQVKQVTKCPWHILEHHIRNHKISCEWSGNKPFLALPTDWTHIMALYRQFGE